MKSILSKSASEAVVQHFRRSFAALLAVAVLIAVLSSSGSVRAGVLYVPNSSFETPVTTNLDIDLDSWQDNPQPSFFDPSDFGGEPWEALMGHFLNTDPGSFDHLDNIDGTQAAYIFTFPTAGFFQDNNSVDWSGTTSHAFNSVFEVGRSYHLTTAFTSSSNEPLTNGASLEMALYYRDVSNNMVVVAETNVVFDTNVFTNLDHFIDFTVDVLTVATNDAWAGQNIGILFSSTTFDPDLVTGVWDLDNVRLTSTISVPNGSFETPPTTNLDLRIDAWQDNPQPSFFDPSDFGDEPWQALMGRFLNTDPGSFDHLDNIDGTQAAYIFTFPTAGFFQDYDSVDWSNTVPNHAFNVTLDPGKSYTLTTAFTSSSNEPLTNGASLEMSLYYGDGPSNMIVLAENNVVFETNVFTNLDHLLDFSATIPEVKATDPWAGKHIGISFSSTTFDPSLVTGVWDLDNVRLTEVVATALNSPAVNNGLLNFTLQSEPGLKFEILAATNLTSSATWTSLVTLTNTTGNFPFSDSAANGQRFYKARQLP